MRWFAFVVGILLTALALPLLASADDLASPGALAAAQGEANVQRLDFMAAMRAYSQAAKAEPGNQVYRERFLQLRRVTSIKHSVDTRPNDARWLPMVVTLHAFYLSEGLDAAALDLDRHAHTRLGKATTAVLLSETLLRMNRPAEVVSTLSPRQQKTWHEDVLLGIALARLQKMEEAKVIDGRVSGADVNQLVPVQIQDLARLKARLDDVPKSLALLKTSLEKTPATAIDVARSRIRAEADYENIRSLPSFAKVLETKSLVPQTCSGGSSCGSCPNRGGCGAGK